MAKTDMYNFIIHHGTANNSFWVTFESFNHDIIFATRILPSREECERAIGILKKNIEHAALYDKNNVLQPAEEG